MEDSPETEQSNHITQAPLVSGARHYIKVANHDHIVELATNEEMSLREFIELVKEQALDLCSAVPVVGVFNGPEEGHPRRDDISFH